MRGIALSRVRIKTVRKILPPAGAHFMHWLAVEMAVTALETVLFAGA